MLKRSTLRSTLAASLAAAATTLAMPSFAITGTVQEFALTKSFSLSFRDSFDDNLAPPSSPNFESGASHTYHVGTATFPAGSEANGVLHVNSAFGVSGTLADFTPTFSQRATVMTDGNANNSFLGLKPNHTFTVTALVDITGASGPGSFAVRFADRIVNINNIDSTVAELVSVEFVPDAGIVRLRRQDFVTHEVFDISSTAVPVAADQVRLLLQHGTANNPQVVGAAQFYDDGVSIGFVPLAGSANIFTYRGFTRAEFSASQPIPEPETYAMMLVGLGVVGWHLRRRAQAERALRFA